MTRLALSLAIVFLAACSSTSSGQTGSSSGASSSGSTSSSGGSSGSTGCPSIAGTWRVTGGCGSDSCVITQDGCSTNYRCSDGAASYTGSVSGSTVNYSGTSADGIPGTCTGTLNGSTVIGTCNTGDIMCSFTATKQ